MTTHWIPILGHTIQLGLEVKDLLLGNLNYNWMAWCDAVCYLEYWYLTFCHSHWCFVYFQIIYVNPVDLFVTLHIVDIRRGIREGDFCIQTRG